MDGTDQWNIKTISNAGQTHLKLGYFVSRFMIIMSKNLNFLTACIDIWTNMGQTESDFARR
jgi:hypothetical protein